MAMRTFKVALYGTPWSSPSQQRTRCQTKAVLHAVIRNGRPLRKFATATALFYTRIDLLLAEKQQELSLRHTGWTYPDAQSVWPDQVALEAISLRLHLIKQLVWCFQHLRLLYSQKGMSD